MTTVSLQQGGWRALTSTCPEALESFRAFAQKGLNVEVVWACFGVTCWWCSDPAVYQQKALEGQIVFYPSELEHLEFLWNDKLEMAVFGWKVFFPGSIFFVKDTHIYLQPPGQEASELTPEWTEAMLRSVSTSPRYRWFYERMQHYVSYRQQVSTMVAQEGLKQIGERGILAASGRCPDCNGLQYITHRGYECHAGHSYPERNIPF